MTRPGRGALGAVLTASLALGGGAMPVIAAAPAGTAVRVGRADGFSHIEFQGVQPRSARRDGPDLVLRFPGRLAPDLAELRADPPPFLKTASAEEVDGATEIRLTLAQGADARIGRADGAAYVNLFAAAAAPPVADRTPAPRVSPVPPSGAVKLEADLNDGQLQLRFPWRAPLGAAAFRRGHAIWLVFDAKARLDLSNAPNGLAEIGKLEVVPSDHALAIRIPIPATTLANVAVDGATWTLTLGPQAGSSPTAVPLKPDGDSLTAAMPGATGVFWLVDPAVGDRLAVVTALGPAKGVATRRQFVDADVLPTVHGFVVEPHAGDLTVASDGDVVRIGRPGGLALSPPSEVVRKAGAPIMGLPEAAALPALVDFDGWSRTGPGGFLARYDQLQALVAEETAKGAGAGVQARLGLARFLVGSELAFEAIGQLDLIAKQSPPMLQDREFRGLRGAARAMAGRYKEAAQDFSFPGLAADPSSALWRGYIAAKTGDVAGARQSHAAGRTALALFTPKWRSRFARADAEVSITAGDLASAEHDLMVAAVGPLPPVEADALKLDQARLALAHNHPDQALPLFEEASLSGYGGVSSPALLAATEIKLQDGRLSPGDAVKMLDSLRFRWRGDVTELDTARALARIYLSQGRYRDALEALRAAGRNLPDLPESAAVQADLQTAFKSLFLTGGADGLPPVQALGLFFDFKDLTPIGADGDEMVRKLARRLVDVDLLDQAAELLKYQADNRLDGIARADVDTDLAVIQLMNRQPEQALDALNSSRSTLLPRELAARRRVLQARALAELGRYEDADEILAGVNDADALDVRADIAWRRRDWPTAAALLDQELGNRWKSAAPLEGLDQGRLLRAGVAYSLAGDATGLARLRARYGRLADASPDTNSLKVALAGLEPGAYTAADYAKATSDADAFAGWITAMKAKLLAGQAISASAKG